MNEKTLTIDGPEGASLVGVLRAPSSGSPSSSPIAVPSAPIRLVLILHGALGHKNYLFLPRLAQQLDAELGLASYRFDFRGNGDSDGNINYADFENDIADIRCVHDALETMGYIVVGMVGHSRGGWATLKYVATQRPVGFAVNVASRYLMNDVLRKHSKEEKEQLAREGFFLWPYKRKGQKMELKVTQADIEKFTKTDTAHIARISPSVAVLTCHGLDDDTVPVENAAHIANLVPNHTLRLIPGAEHTFKEKKEEVTQAVIDWLQSQAKASRSLRLDRAYRHISLSRFVMLQGVTNCRDVGGYPTLDGGIVRPRKFFRSGEMTGATAKDVQLLTSLDIHTIFDLRSDPEIQSRGVVDLKGATDLKCVHCPVFKDEDYSPEALAQRWQCYTQGPQGFCNAYLQILEKGGDCFKLVFEAMANNPTGAILVHCTAGKDRTGVIVMLFLLLLGVQSELICWDYEQTELFLKRDKEQIERIKTWTHNKIDDEGAFNMISASFDSMDLTLKAFKERWHSVENYLQQIGIGEVTQRVLREKYRSSGSVL